MPVRCFQCKTPVIGLGTGRDHASLTGHIWTPGYYCRFCEATFHSHTLCKAHQKACIASVPKTASISTAPAPKVAPASTTTAHHERKTSISNIVSCATCGEHFRDAQTLGEHHREHEASGSSTSKNTTTKSECSVCKLEFTNDLRLAYHAASVNPCTVCSICIPLGMMSLQEHYRSSVVHAACPWCEQGFLSSLELGFHARECTARPRSPVGIPASELGSSCESDWHTVDAKGNVAHPEPAFVPETQSQSVSSQPERSSSTEPYTATQEAASITCTTTSTVKDFPVTVRDKPPAAPSSENPVGQQLSDDSVNSVRPPHPLFDVPHPLLDVPHVPPPSPPPRLAIPSHIPFGPNGGTQRTELAPKSAIEYDRFTDDADRSSVIAKAALDLLSQRYGMGAAGRVLRAMQELGDMLTDRQSEGGVGGEAPQHTDRHVARAEGTSSTPKSMSPRSCSSPSSAVLRFVASQSADPATEDVESVHSVQPIPAVKRSPVAPSTRKPAPSASRPQQSINQSGPQRPHEKTQSWHCRACMTEVCTKPVATVCGHIFCRDCLIRELEDHGACPVCKKVFLIKLDVAVA
ncbi:hypothetical protein C2E23DRAFT_410986 [Lenzites betulinus]|nr:hypothetical protein C2E23DRAFT_410986 [Lenzites betulinus]